MDMTRATAPKSDQLNNEDLRVGPRTFTITDVREGSAEQPVRVFLAEGPDGRPYLPNVTMCRLMVLAWGPDSDAYIGKRLTLYRDPDATFGKEKTGGIRISHMSGIRKAMTANLPISKGRWGPYRVEPLPDVDPLPAKVPGPLDQLVWAMNAAKIPQENRLPYCCGVIGREVADPRAMTADEIGKVVEVLRKQTPAPSGEPSEEELEAAFLAEQERTNRG